MALHFVKNIGCNRQLLRHTFSINSLYASHEESFRMPEQGVFKWVRVAIYTAGAKDEQR